MPKVIQQAVLLAGGKGTRLSSVSGELPKPMVGLAGLPIIERQILFFAKNGIKDILILTGHLSKAIESYCGDGSRFGVKIRYSVEKEPLGTSGSVMDAIDLLDEFFFVAYSDTVFDIDLQKMTAFHFEREGVATLLLHPNDHPYDSDLVETDSAHSIVRIHKYPHPSGAYLRNLVNAAFYLVEKKALLRAKELPKNSDFMKHLFPSLLNQGLALNGYPTREYIKDMGTPDRFEKVQSDVLAGKLEYYSLKNKIPCVFLDRDGTLTQSKDYVRKPEELVLMNDAADSIKAIHHSKHLAVLITNQPVIARGECDEATMQQIHNRLETNLGNERTFLDGIYYCPHHPDSGFSGERKDLKMKCCCRKPADGMIRAAQSDLQIDLSKSWMIGDSTADIGLAKNAGLKSVLLGTGEAGRDGKNPCRPDFEASTLSEAVTIALDIYPKLNAEIKKLDFSFKKGQVILVGGLARSGKSSFASTLAYECLEKGFTPKVLSLDSFLLPAEQRKEGILGRYDLPAIDLLGTRLSKRPLQIEQATYDRLKRAIESKKWNVEILPDDVVIIEGVVALAIESLLKVNSETIYVECPETVRRSRLEKDYLSRGMSSDQIESIYQSREQDETPIIRSSKLSAQNIFSSEVTL